MKVVGLLNEKGGSGKSTWAVTLAAGLAERGNSVVLVDADPQGDATLTLGLNRSSGFADMMYSDAPWSELLNVVDPGRWSSNDAPTGALHLLPGSKDTQNVVTLQSNTRLLSRMRELEETGIVDYVIIDPNPSPNRLHTFMCLAADAIVTPAQLAFLNIKGVVDTTSSIAETAQERKIIGLPDLDVVGIIPTKARMRTQLHSHNYRYLREYYGDKIWTPAPLSIVWEEATQERMSIYAYRQDSEAIRVADENVTALEEAMHGH